MFDMEIDEQKLREILSEQQKETERYIGSIKEDFDNKLDIVLEQTSVVPEIQRTLNATFDKVGEIATDVEMIKEVAKGHEQRIQKLETAL